MKTDTSFIKGGNFIVNRKIGRRMELRDVLRRAQNDRPILNKPFYGNILTDSINRN